MFDNLRQISDEDEVEEQYPFEVEPVYQPPRRIFGMTAAQRFFISLLLLGTVIVMGISCLLVFEKIWYF
jgi:hypothetical protein